MLDEALQNKRLLGIDRIPAVLLECAGRTERQLCPVCALIAPGADELLRRYRLRPAEQFRVERQIMQLDLLHLFQNRHRSLTKLVVQKIDRPHKCLPSRGEVQELRDRMFTLFMQSIPKFR